MPITKSGDVVTYTQGHDNDRTVATDVHPSDNFAVCDAKDPLKQLKFDCSGLATDSSSTITASANGITAGNLNLTYLSAVSVGGGAAEAYTITGLLATDTIMSVTPVATTNSEYILGHGTLINDGLTVTYSGDPGANSQVRVTVKRA